MKRRTLLLCSIGLAALMVLGLAWTPVGATRADERPRNTQPDNTQRADEQKANATRRAAPNAAVIYWQAFSAMPNLNEAERLQLTEATKFMNAPLDDKIRPVVDQFDQALRQMHRATQVVPCDWQLNEDDGPFLLLPHLQKARDLARVALLRARLRFAAGEQEAAVGDVLDTIHMARDCGSSPLIIAYLVTVAIERSASDVLAAQLPKLSADQLERIAKSLPEMPATAAIAECFQWEATYIGGWFERLVESEAAKISDPAEGLTLLSAAAQAAGVSAELEVAEGDVESERRRRILKSLTVADVRASVKRLHADYESIIKVAAEDRKARAEQLPRLADELAECRKLAKREDAQRYVSVMLLPTFALVGDRERTAFVRQQLLIQAIDVQRHGAANVRPIDGMKVEYHKTQAGFELRCLTGAKPEVLSVGE